MTVAETNASIATSGQNRAATEFDEIVINNVSVPVRSIQRTDTSRFEGKVTIGDYSVDSDQLMSTWAQSNWVGGMNIADHIEGATENRFRYGRAWTMSSRQLTLPLHAYYLSPHHTSSADNLTDLIGAATSVIASGGTGLGLPYQPWLFHHYASVPLGHRYDVIYAACGLALNVIDTSELISDNAVSASSPGNFAHVPVGPGAWYPDSNGTLLLWVPLGSHGIQTYNPTNDAIGSADTAIEAVAVMTWDTKLYALTTDGRLRYRDRTGSWDTGTNDSLKLPEEEVPRHLVSYFDRAGNPCVTIITSHQAWIYQPDADAITPLGYRWPFGRESAAAAAVWRDDGLYVAKGLGVYRMSTAGVKTFMGLDRDDGYDVAAIDDDTDPERWRTNPRITAMAPGENFLIAAVSGPIVQNGSSYESHIAIMAWNEAGWHHVSTIKAPINAGDVGTGAEQWVASHMIVADTLDGYVVVVGLRTNGFSAPDAKSRLYFIPLPEDAHAPKASVLSQPTKFATNGVFYTGWFDAGMANFYKAWSHFEVYLANPEDGSDEPPGIVRVYYRTEHDPETWTLLGTASDFGRTIMEFGVDSGFSYGEVSLKIEFKLEIVHDWDTIGTPRPDTPVIEALSLKFIKLAQYGSAWLVHVPLSDFETWGGNGPQAIDEFLNSLTVEGSSKGPFSKLLHRRKADGTVGTYRIRAAQWQRAESTGNVPFGDGVLNLIMVPIQEIEGVDA